MVVVVVVVVVMVAFSDEEKCDAKQILLTTITEVTEAGESF